MSLGLLLHISRVPGLPVKMSEYYFKIQEADKNVS